MSRTSLDPQRCVNFIGLPHRMKGDGPESYRLLREVGLTVVANFPSDASFRDWGSIRFAKASFVADRGWYHRLLTRLEEGGQEVHEVPLPTGLTQTDEFLARIGRVYGVEEALRKAAEPYREQAVRRIALFQERYAGMHLAMGLRMLNNYAADQIAYLRVRWRSHSGSLTPT